MSWYVLHYGVIPSQGHVCSVPDAFECGEKSLYPGTIIRCNTCHQRWVLVPASSKWGFASWKEVENLTRREKRRLQGKKSVPLHATNPPAIRALGPEEVREHEPA